MPGEKVGGGGQKDFFLLQPFSASSVARKRRKLCKLATSGEKRVSSLLCQGSLKKFCVNSTQEEHEKERGLFELCGGEKEGGVSCMEAKNITHTPIHPYLCNSHISNRGDLIS